MTEPTEPAEPVKPAEPAEPEEEAPEGVVEEPTGEVVRVRLPRGKEVLGIVEEMLGASRFKVRCQDGKERICRIPGKFRRSVRIRTGDLVLIEPWDVQPEDRADVLWRYTRNQALWLEKKGRTKGL